MTSFWEKQVRPMKTEIINNYAAVLYELKPGEDAVSETEKILSQSRELVKALSSPAVPDVQKELVIERVFPRKLHTYLKVVCRHGRAEQLSDILQAYQALADREGGILRATLLCTSFPDGERKKRIESFLRKKYGARKVVLQMRIEPELIGGFLLLVGDEEFDWSLRGRLRRLEQTLRK